jgi:glutathione S-transferase
VLGYWNIRGLAQVPRLLLSYCGLEWEDQIFNTPAEWAKKKKELDFQFPSLPYLIQGDFKLTKVRAINSYIIKVGGKPELLGKDPRDQAVVEELLGALQDIKAIFIPLFSDKDYEQKL